MIAKCFTGENRDHLLELCSNGEFNFYKIYLTIQLQQLLSGQNMIAICFKGQNRDMQNFSWNLDNFNFGLGFEPSTCKICHTNHPTMKFCRLYVQYGTRITRLVELNRMALTVFKIPSNYHFFILDRREQFTHSFSSFSFLVPHYTTQ